MLQEGTRARATCSMRAGCSLLEGKKDEHCIGNIQGKEFVAQPNEEKSCLTLSANAARSLLATMQHRQFFGLLHSPLSTKWSLLRVALSFMLTTSLPLPASDIASAPMCSPIGDCPSYQQLHTMLAGNGLFDLDFEKRKNRSGGVNVCADKQPACLRKDSNQLGYKV
eukprot:1138987-Pelagomonas_calceolata.AAC.16